jgi:hypothetical protein
MNVPIGHERRIRTWFINIFTRKNNKIAPIVLERKTTNSSNSSSKNSSADLEVKFEPQDSLKIAKLRIKGKPSSTRKSLFKVSRGRRSAHSSVSPSVIPLKLNPMHSRPRGSSKVTPNGSSGDFVNLVPRNKGGKTRKRKC